MTPDQDRMTKMSALLGKALGVLDGVLLMKDDVDMAFIERIIKEIEGDYLHLWDKNPDLDITTEKDGKHA